MFVYNQIIKIILGIEKILYKVRDAFWSYPEYFDPNKEYNRKLTKLYISSVPYSHYILATLVLFFITLPLISSSAPHVFGSTRGLLIEGVVMGTDSNGNVQKINKINPLLPSNIQLEKDLVGLIYEPLIRYQYVQDEAGKSIGGVQNVLAKEIITLLPGANYEIVLKENILWHDSFPGSDHILDAGDVIATFDLYASLNEENTSNIYTKTLKQLQWIKIDDFTIRVCTNPDIETAIPCDGSTRINYPIFSNFLELISFNIIPEESTREIDSSNVDSSSPRIYRNPVGTGLFKLKNSSENSISVEVNKHHGLYSNNMDVTSIRFEYFTTLADAISALQNAEIHSLATLSIEYKDRLKEYTQIEEHVSDVLYNQFWALYFNLRTRPDQTSIAPEFLQDVRVRKAISSAINRQKITDETLRGIGTEAYGPIPDISYFFNPDAGWNIYDKEEAENLLDEAGWRIRGGNEYRTNSQGIELSFSLYFVDNFDRSEVAKSIKADLAEIGVNAIINRQEQAGNQVSESRSEGWSLQELNDQLLSPGLFDVILYGMQTFIDPDRYELYHSSQTRYPGLNIAGYVSTEQTVDKNEDRQEGESSVIQVPKVDRFLDLARSFNPEVDKEARKDRYTTIQELIAADAPVAYLYHPQYLYFTNKVLTDVSLTGADSLEERFINIHNWELD